MCPLCHRNHIGVGYPREYSLTKAGYLLLAQMRAAENAKRRAA